jgi:hypothetical protein
MTTRTTPRPESSFPSRNLAEWKKPQGWVHHVADAATGKLLMTQLDPGQSRRYRGPSGCPGSATNFNQ